MARHSHWAQIKLKKGSEDVKRGKIFTRHARLIEMAARTGGGDPATNANLRMAIENARAENLPRENIDRAIKKGTGELKAGEQLQEITYEGYGPGGSAFLIETVTDNRNRTGQMVRRIVEEHGGRMGIAGSVGYLFESKGELEVLAKGPHEEDELAMIDAGAEDLEEFEGGFFVYIAGGALGDVKKNLEAGGFTVKSAKLVKAPKTSVEISDPVLTQKISELVEALEENDDVSEVWTNATRERSERA